MSTASNSSPIAARRVRVTEVAQVIETTGIEAVMKADERVAIHLATRNGIVIVRCSLRDFNAKCRAPLDHNNRPFTSKKDSLQVAEADAAATAAKGGLVYDLHSLSNNNYGAAGLPPQLITQLRHAFFDAGRELSVKTVAYELGIHPKTVRKYFKKFAEERAAQTAPITKPNGKLL